MVAVQILGDVRVVGARGTRPVASGRVLEVVTYLAVRPGSSPEAWREALVPGTVGTGRAQRVRCEYMRQARRWLGEDERGRPFVPLVAQAGYRLDGVSCDLDDFAALVGQGRMVEALRLVRGRPFSGLGERRWEWAQPIKSRWCATVAEVARSAAVEQARAGRWGVVREAAETGVQADPGDEWLWRAAVGAARRVEGEEAAESVRVRARAALAGLA